MGMNYLARQWIISIEFANINLLHCRRSFNTKFATTHMDTLVDRLAGWPWQRRLVSSSQQSCRNYSVWLRQHYHHHHHHHHNHLACLAWKELKRNDGLGYKVKHDDEEDVDDDPLKIDFWQCNNSHRKCYDGGQVTSNLLANLRWKRPLLIRSID